MTIADVSLVPPRRAFSRRQALKIVAASAAVPVAVAGWRMFGPAPTFHNWEGEALGAVSSMSIWHSNKAYAERTIAAMVAEVERLENVFSLYRANSELSVLNRDGQVAGVSRDLVTVFNAAQAGSSISNGAFDATVQPLWDVYLNHFGQPDADPAGPPRAAIDAALRFVNFRNVDVTGRSVRFAVPGMSATLNGIAQGYITDYVADILRNEGFEHVVVELGETRVVGLHPDGRPWHLGLRDQEGTTNRMIDVADGAVAMSAGYGTMFDASGRNHHIFDPATGLSAHKMIDVVVTAPRAMDADALTKAVLVGGEERAPAALAAYPGARAIITRTDGSTATLG